MGIGLASSCFVLSYAAVMAYAIVGVLLDEMHRACVGLGIVIFQVVPYMTGRRSFLTQVGRLVCGLEVFPVVPGVFNSNDWVHAGFFVV